MMTSEELWPKEKSTGATVGESRAEFDHGCLAYGVTARGTYARSGDDIWNWRLEHERLQREVDWRYLERQRRTRRWYRASLEVLYWSLVALTVWVGRRVGLDVR